MYTYYNLSLCLIFQTQQKPVHFLIAWSERTFECFSLYLPIPLFLSFFEASNVKMSSFKISCSVYWIKNFSSVGECYISLSKKRAINLLKISWMNDWNIYAQILCCSSRSHIEKCIANIFSYKIKHKQIYFVIKLLIYEWKQWVIKNMQKCTQRILFRWEGEQLKQLNRLFKFVNYLNIWKYIGSHTD